ncbi:MAG: hypothetical protein QXU20_01615 [Candidatus Woesearchaeota archaeon]
MPERLLEELINKEFNNREVSEREELINILKQTIPLNLPKDYVLSNNKEEYLNERLKFLEQKALEEKELKEKRNFLEKGFDIKSNARILGYLSLMHGLYDKAKEFFNYAVEFGDKIHSKDYEVILKKENMEGISNILKEFYSEVLSKEYKSINIEGISKKQEYFAKGEKEKRTNEKNKDKVKPGIIIGVTAGIAALVCSLTTYKVINDKFEKKLESQKHVYEEQIRELNENYNLLEEENSNLKNQILSIEESAKKPVYTAVMLGKGETVTHKVAEYLDLVLGKYYDDLSTQGRIKLINDFTKMLYNIRENYDKNLRIENVRNLPENFLFYIPNSVVSIEKTPKGETWVLKGSYNDLNNKIKEYIFSGFKY